MAKMGHFSLDKPLTYQYTCDQQMRDGVSALEHDLRMDAGAINASS